MGLSVGARRLVVIRHGQSQAFVDQVVVSHDCKGLSELGVAQAEALRARLARTGELADATVLWTSLMRRAAETAEIISGAVGDGSLDVSADCGFCEQHHGQGDGLRWEDYKSRYGSFDGFAERSRVPAPGAESVGQLVARAGTALRELVAREAGATVVVVAHGGVVGAALEALVGVETGSINRYVENTSLTEFGWDDARGRWTLVRLNDAAHLA